VRADAVVVAAGSGQRMQGIDKLLAPIAGRPLLGWTLAAVVAAPEIERMVVVVAPANVELVRAAAWLPAAVVAVVPGGARRQESVAAGVRALEALDRGRAGAVEREDRVVVIHDGARPLVSGTLVGEVARAAAEHGAAVPVLPLVETVKRIDGDLIGETVDRSGLAVAQTPQGARAAVLRTAWRTFPPEAPREFTDEAALLEACRIPVHAIRGEPGNLKVTMPDDLGRVADAIAGQSGARIGLGLDRHPFGPGEPLMLGGIEVPGAPRLHGHSDGDVVLHALADALLGAAGLGDLGTHFPADHRTPRGIASREMLAAVVSRVSAAGYRPGSVDLTITAGRPRLGRHLSGMRDAIAGLLGIDPGQVSVKAATGNLGGDEGAGRAISAEVIARLEWSA
jgi:2-C-methyl-D-erythritol 4-phosphate cytidylyltransferase/2-C-methyl-D-erythritol 2,4-cyclodiphosphate synthase